MATFIDDRDCNQALLSMNYYRFKKPPMKLSRYKSLSLTEQTRLQTILLNTNQTLVDICCFVLMPNHFHFILRQNLDNGVSTFIRKFTNSYARYFNTSHKWVGHLFQGQFKAIEISSEEYSKRNRVEFERDLENRTRSVQRIKDERLDILKDYLSEMFFTDSFIFSAGTRGLEANLNLSNVLFHISKDSKIVGLRHKFAIATYDLKHKEARLGVFLD